MQFIPVLPVKMNATREPFYQGRGCCSKQVNLIQAGDWGGGGRTRIRPMFSGDETAVSGVTMPAGYHCCENY